MCLYLYLCLCLYDAYHGRVVHYDEKNVKLVPYCNHCSCGGILSVAYRIVVQPKAAAK